MNYHFTCAAVCEGGGETATLRNFRVVVEAESFDEARASVKAVAIEMIHDEGSRLLDWPADNIEIRDIRRA